MPRRVLLTFFFTPPPPSPLPTQSLLLQPHNSNNSRSNLNPSLFYIGGIVLIVLVVSTSLHLLLRYLNSRCTSSNEVQDDDDDHEHVAPIEPVQVHRGSGSRVAPEDKHESLIDSLPLFSFDSVSALRRSSSANCAVCLSKFEPHDLLRLLPICCHAFHSRCIDAWLLSNQTCPLCRSTIHVDQSEGFLKLFSSSSSAPVDSSGGDRSFRIEIGSVSHRRAGEDSAGESRRRSYSMGSFEYLVDEEEYSEVFVVPEHRQGDSESRKKNDAPASDDRAVNPPGADVAAEVAAGGRGGGWLREYVDRIASSRTTMSSSSSSSRALSSRISGRIFTGSSRRTEGFSGSSRRGEGSWDFDRNGLGEEIGNFFRWLSGV